MCNTNRKEVKNMEVKTVGKDVEVTEAINDYVERKIERIDKY